MLADEPQVAGMGMGGSLRAETGAYNQCKKNFRQLPRFSNVCSIFPGNLCLTQMGCSILFLALPFLTCLQTGGRSLSYSDLKSLESGRGERSEGGGEAASSPPHGLPEGLLSHQAVGLSRMSVEQIRGGSSNSRSSSYDNVSQVKLFVAFAVFIGAAVALCCVILLASGDPSS